jgi:hypothetical protein
MSDDINLRQWMNEQLKPAFPKTWAYVDTNRTIDSLEKITVMLSQNDIRRAASNPQGAYDVDYELTIAAPNKDPEKGEYLLDDQVIDLLVILDKVKKLRWSSATKGIVLAAEYPGYQIKFTITVPKKKEA